jgi:hypothetical protein
MDNYFLNFRDLEPTTIVSLYQYLDGKKVRTLEDEKRLSAIGQMLDFILENPRTWQTKSQQLLINAYNQK